MKGILGDPLSCDTDTVYKAVILSLQLSASASIGSHKAAHTQAPVHARFHHTATASIKAQPVTASKLPACNAIIFILCARQSVYVLTQYKGLHV